ncbi:MAG: hypothetical protein V4467_01130 [Patescibacteria group bacterium]
MLAVLVVRWVVVPLIAFYLLVGLVRMVGVVTMDHIGISREPWLDWWWTPIVSGIFKLKDTVINGLLITLGTIVAIYFATGMIRVLAQIVTNSVFTDRPWLDWWWVKLVDWFFPKKTAE